ncbi:MAG: hypothetical protein C0168_07310 [Candidatus Aminicenantes bacterium]|nr:MAG: hypothetical protein C0168_07310 [Candidatus Aminicenantes bacterium]
MINLDYFCAKYGQEIADKADKNTLQKALGVLREDGVYAMFLWLEDKDKNIRCKMLNLLNENDIKKFLSPDSSNFPDEFKQFCETLRNVAQDIDKLLFLKKILERTLTYALYHAKVKGEKNVEQS